MTDNRTTELLPCPLCGKANTLEIQKPNVKYAAQDNYFVVCNIHDGGCGASGGTRRTEAEAIAAWNTRADRHPYEQRITGDGSDWGEIMIDAYDDLMASAGESCTPEQMRKLADYIRAELGSGMCKLEPLSALDVTLNMLELTEWGACSECGYAVPMDARFCNECGKAVKR